MIVKWASRLGFGLMEQAISSVSNFAFVIALAHKLSALQFGRFSMCWAAIMLAEALFWSLFGDSIPSIFNKFKASNFGKLRSALGILSTLSSAIVLIVGLLVAAVFVKINTDIALLIACSSFGIFCFRFQQLLRRICYFDNNRILPLFSSIVFSVIVFAFVLLTSFVKSASHALIALSISWIVSGSLLLFYAKYFAMPRPRIVKIISYLIWIRGKWLIGSSISYWISNTGLVPLAGFLFGVESSGLMRILQNITTPLTQIVAVIYSILIPHCATIMKGGDFIKAKYISILCIISFGIVGFSYASILSLSGHLFLDVLFPGKTQGLTFLILALTAFSAGFDSLRSGAAIPLVAVGMTKPVFMSRTAGLLALGCGFAATSGVGGILGLVASMVAANLVATIVVLFYLVLYLRSK